jgi:hypothetical protein
MQKKIVHEENAKITKTINRSIEETVIRRAKLGDVVDDYSLAMENLRIVK